MTSSHVVRGELALTGGAPVRTRPWPQWPVASAEALDRIARVLAGRAWTLTGQSPIAAPLDREVGRRWAELVGVRHALACSSGTAALNMALDALDIGPGDEVIVPGLTWIACPQSVCNAGAIPVLVDVDRDTLCISADAARAAITPRTRAIMIVHAYCSVADLDAFVALAADHGLPLIEDCSQAHGAEWRHRRVGSFGTIATFSTHQSKTLTSGEGGLCCTDSPELYLKLQELRTDGRVYAAGVDPTSWMSVTRVGTTQGRNLALSEIGCALLLDGMDRLLAQRETRARNVARLSERLRTLPGIDVIGCPAAVTARAVSRLIIRIDPEQFGTADVTSVARAVTAELNLPVEGFDRPLNKHPLYNPLSLARLNRRSDANELDPARFHLPVADRESVRCVAAPHFCLLGGDDDVLDMFRAFEKVYERQGDLQRVVARAT